MWQGFHRLAIRQGDVLHTLPEAIFAGQHGTPVVTHRSVTGPSLHDVDRWPREASTTRLMACRAHLSVTCARQTTTSTRWSQRSHEQCRSPRGGPRRGRGDAGELSSSSPFRRRGQRNRDILLNGFMSVAGSPPPSTSLGPLRAIGQTARQGSPPTSRETARRNHRPTSAKACRFLP